MQRGVHAILYAFFGPDEALDRAAMRRQVALCIEARVAGVAALGLATEVQKLSFTERCRLMDWVAEDVNARVPLGFTIYGQSVAEQLAMVRHAERAGADWLVLQPPQVGAYPAEEYIAFFSRVMGETVLPCAIQNAPQYLGRGLSDADIAVLRNRHANFSVIKAEASAEDAARLKDMAGADFRVFNGRGGLDMIACLDGGCDGFLLAPDAVDYGVLAMQLYDAGQAVAAQAVHERALPAITFIMRSIEHLICYGKRLFVARAGLEVFDRAPALRPAAAELATLETLARGLGPFPLASESLYSPR
jgi:dihydrodipicolinate synthase/N-acetylneuraminate lyase